MNDKTNKDSLFQKSQVSVYPIHKLPTFKDEKLKTNELRGTVEIKKRTWNDGSTVNFEDYGYNKGTDLFASSNHDENVRENISIHSSTLHSVNIHNKVAHPLLQKTIKISNEG